MVKKISRPDAATGTTTAKQKIDSEIESVRLVENALADTINRLVESGRPSMSCCFSCSNGKTMNIILVLYSMGYADEAHLKVCCGGINDITMMDVSWEQSVLDDVRAKWHLVPCVYVRNDKELKAYVEELVEKRKSFIIDDERVIYR